MRGKIFSMIIPSVMVVAVMALVGCAGTQEVISGTGTVKYIDLEGGFYGIIGDNGEQYDPTNLSPEFQEDCLSVSFEAKVRDDIASTHMWGTVIEITKIEPLGGG